IVSDVQAFVDASARVRADRGDVHVLASNDIDLAGVAGGGGLALEQGAGVGGASTLDGVADMVKAYVGAGSSVDALDLIVNASASYHLLSLAASLAFAGNAAAIGSLSTQVVVDDVEAYIDDGATVTAQGNVVVQAVSQLQSIQLAGGAAIT